MGLVVRRTILTFLFLTPVARTVAGESWPFPWPESRIARYTAQRTAGTIVVDGRLDEADWKAAPKSPRFSDLVRGAPGIHDTRAAVLWDDQNLYVGYWVEEPFVEGTLTERDSLIYKDNDVELFIAGPDAYYELEINSLGTIYEVFFIWEEAYARAGYARLPEFDRGQNGVRPFRGVGFKNHPRGPRIGYWKWDLRGLRTAVHVDGTVNDDSDRDRGWTVELAIPWTGLAQLARADARSLPPRDGDVWRLDFSRFNQYKEAKPAQDPGGWAWSPHGAWDSHIPEVFPYVHFSARPVVAAGPEPAPRWFKGNTHAHTTMSDGDSPPEVVTRWYQDHGYNFLVLSDHNYLTAEGSFPYSRKDDFILIQGEEVTAFYRPSETEDKRPIHVNALNLKAVIEPWSGRDAVETLQRNVDRVRDAGAVPHVNHPNFRWALTAADLLLVSRYRLLEIWNGHPQVHNEGGGERPSVEAVWDELLGAGQVVYGIAVDDAHHFQDEFAPGRSNPGRGWIAVRAPRLEPAALMDALEKGEFYASTGVTLRDVQSDRETLTVKVAVESDFQYTTRFLGPGGAVLATCAAVDCVYRFSGREGYVRATVTDSGGRRAWVQPVFPARGAQPSEAP